jgi:hypothetical protein
MGATPTKWAPKEIAFSLTARVKSSGECRSIPTILPIVPPLIIIFLYYSGAKG